MIKNQDIICISSIDWDFIWQGHQEIMSTFAKNGNRVLFIENTGIRTPTFKDLSRLKKRFINWFRSIKGFSQKMENLYVYSPLVLPFPYSRIARCINRRLLLGPLKRWVKIMQFHDPLIWTFLPTGTALDIINNIDRGLLVYYCIADFDVLVDKPKKVKRTEDELIKKSDLIFVQGEFLEAKCRRLNDNVHIFPFGVNIVNFEKVRLTNIEMPDELRNLNKPIIGYVGGIHRWIDQDLVKFISQRYPNYSFVFVGPLQTDISSLRSIKNIYFVGNKGYKYLPHMIKFFSLTIIPYLLTDYTKNVYPTKLNEYLSMSKPVVSTALPEVLMFNQRYKNIVYVGNSQEEFCECIDRSIREDSDLLREKRIRIAQENSWGNRIQEMCGLIEETAENKKLGKDARWRENLLVFYHRSRRKLLCLTGISTAIYYLLFYTPFVWTLAKPLKIVDAPRKVDAIVVFAGGVGESGKAGQGYEERVKYAVELYKKGYASKVIFSSGYMYVFKEPLVMKALAISLGIPDDAIILEDKAGTTYENVKFTKIILDKEGFNDILLISSPYHMRRSLLVFNKIAKNIKVLYTPIPNSFFYFHIDSGMRSKKINLQQINGIIHEYLGILYYWWKGLI